MEKRTEYLFYIGIGQKELIKTVLAFPSGQMVVYSYFLPEALVLNSQGRLPWRRKRKSKHQTKKIFILLKEAVESVREELAEGRITYVYMTEAVSQRLKGEQGLWRGSDEEALLDRLYEVCLYQKRQICKETALSLSLEAECGELAIMRLLAIIRPYLSRINHVVFVGEEDTGTQMLEDYLYDEYGIVMTYDRFPARNTIWIDLRDRENQKLSKYAKERGICHINRAEVLKFLDTAVKNGYNTKVN